MFCKLIPALLSDDWWDRWVVRIRAAHLETVGPHYQFQVNNQAALFPWQTRLNLPFRFMHPSALPTYPWGSRQSWSQLTSDKTQGPGGRVANKPDLHVFGHVRIQKKPVGKQGENMQTPAPRILLVLGDRVNCTTVLPLSEFKKLTRTVAKSFEAKGVKIQITLGSLETSAINMGFFYTVNFKAYQNRKFLMFFTEVWFSTEVILFIPTLLQT